MQTKSEAQFEQHRFFKVMTQEVIKELGGDDGFRESKTYYELVTNSTKYYQKKTKRYREIVRKREAIWHCGQYR